MNGIVPAVQHERAPRGALKRVYSTEFIPAAPSLMAPSSLNVGAHLYSGSFAFPWRPNLSSMLQVAPPFHLNVLTPAPSTTSSAPTALSVPSAPSVPSVPSAPAALPLPATQQLSVLPQTIACQVKEDEVSSSANEDTFSRPRPGAYFIRLKVIRSEMIK